MGFATTNAFIIGNTMQGNSAQLGRLNNNEALYNSIGQPGNPNTAFAQEQRLTSQNLNNDLDSQIFNTEYDSLQKQKHKNIHDAFIGFHGMG